MKKATFKERFRYRFENTMSAGPIGVIRWLAIISIVSVMILGLLMVIFGISDSVEPDAQPLGFIESVWKSLMATLDPGTMGGDEGWGFRTLRFVSTLVGIFIISILIGTISSGIDEKISELKKGRSKVLESNHTLILGWSEKIFSIISEIVEANSNQRKPSIVILSEKDKEEAEDEIRSKVPNTGNTRIVVRSGSPLDSADIQVVSPNAARSVIVLSPEKENADTQVIKTVLGLTNGKNRKKEPFHIVAEIRDVKNMEAAELVGNNETIFVLSADLLARITAQTCRQSGLSVVYSELLQFEGDEIYFAEEPKLFGKTYQEALFSFGNSSVIGIITASREVLINPPMDTVINKGDSVIAISEDDDTIVYNGKPDFKADEELFQRAAEVKAAAERTLILGWNERGLRIVEELDNYVGEGSEVMIVSEDENLVNALADLKESLSKQSLTVLQGIINEKKTLEGLEPEKFDHIIVLSDPDMDIQESDARTLICLLHLRNLSEKCGKDFSIVTEMLDLRNRELGVVAKADDFIVGDNLTSLFLSQLSENKELKKVYDILFESEGSEIYLKPVSRYVKTGVPIDFYTVVASAAALNESAIGYRISSLSDNSDEHFGVKINPAKSAQVVYSPEDFIVVLSED